MTLYEELEVPATASVDEIKAAYRRLAQAYHPDRNLGATEAVRRMAEDRLKRLNAAYAVLKDPEKKQKYDAGLRVVPKPSPPQTPRHEPTRPQPKPKRPEPDLKREAELAGLRQQIKDIAQRRERLDGRFRRRLSQAEQEYEAALEAWRLSRSRAQRASDQRRYRALWAWLAAGLGTIGVVGLGVSLATAGASDGGLVQTWLGRLAIAASVLAFEIVLGGAALHNLGVRLRRLVTGLRWRSWSMGLVAGVVLVFVAAMLVADRLDANNPATYAWPLLLHVAVGGLWFVQTRVAIDLPPPEDRSADVRHEHQHTLSEFDATVAGDLRALLARLRVRETQTA